jgi:PAS domain S-box-containing protein
MRHTNTRSKRVHPLLLRLGAAASALLASSARTLTVTFLFLATGIICAGYFYTYNHREQFQEEAQRQLSAIADLKVGELQLWREERLGDAGLFYQNSAFAALVQRCFQHPEIPEPTREIEAWLGHIKADRNYNRIFLLDAQGKSRISLPVNHVEPISPLVRRRALESMRTGKVTFADFYRQETSGKIYLAIMVPIFEPSGGAAPQGALVMRIDAEQYLYPFIKRWPSASLSAETLLVRREGNMALFLNELRHRKGAALNLSIPLASRNSPSALAALGQEGTVQGLDYRGIPVLAALRRIPDSPWYLVAQMADAELYAPLRERQLITVLLVVAVLSSAGIGVVFIWRQQAARFYRDRHEAQQERVALEERLAGIAASVPGALFQFHLRPDGSAYFPFASHGLVALYGLAPEALTLDAAPFFAAIHPADAPGVAEAFRESARSLSPWHSEHRVSHPQRGDIWLEGIASPEQKPDGSVQFYGFLSDSTERKRAAANLAYQSALLRSIIDSIPDLILYTDVDGLYLGCNKAFEQYAGGTENEQLGKTDFDLFPAERAEFSRLKDREVLEGAQAVSYEEWISYPDGRRVLLDTLKTPFGGGAGEVLGLVGISRDITERKEKERVIEEKNSELERFTYTISHDLKSPLVTIKTFLGYLAEDIKIPDNPRVEQDLGFIHNAADKMSQLLAELLEMSRVGRLNTPEVEASFSELAREAAELNAGSLSTRGVSVQIAQTALLLHGDRARLVEIWQNLVENAGKFMGDQQRPHIEIGIIEGGLDTLFFVQDNGKGIDPRYHEKIFGLFDKLNADSEGTGLGLALVKRIVQTYQGKIWVESAGEGAGTTFFFTLPAAQRKGGT